MLHHRLLSTVLFFSFFALTTAFAQTGSIRGTVKDAKTNEPLIGATVAIQGTTNGSIADVEGNFLLPKVPVGKQVVAITYISYQTKTIEVQVEAGKQIILNTALDEDAGQTLQEVVVTATKATNTEIAVISEIKAATQIAVGVGSQQITRSQDRDAAQVARRVPGVSIVDDRFVLIRGLSQRYNTVMINDVITPSTEVDSRSFSFDLVPSSIIDRMMIYKSGGAELPGEFAGGVIKIYTKRAPEENFTNISLTTGFRTNTTFQESFRYAGGRLDFLGFDDGNRQIPSGFPSSRNFTNVINNDSERAAALGRRLPNEGWAVTPANILPDLRGSFNLGRRFNWGSVQVGNLTSINYSSTNQDITPVEFNTYNERGDEKFAENLDNFHTYASRLGVLHNWSFRFNPNFTIEFKNLFNQLGFRETLVRNGRDLTVTPSNDLLQYSQRFETRSIYTGQLMGKHIFGSRTNLNWTAGLNYTGRTEPDWRRARYTRASNSNQPFTLASGSGTITEAGRFFSDMNELGFVAAVNVERKLKDTEADENAPKLRFGLYAERKDRDYQARFFSYLAPVSGSDAILGIIRQPINQVFAPNNITGNQNGLLFREGTLPEDRYTASNTLLAGYVGASLPIGEKIDLTLGFRGEYNIQQLQSPVLRSQVNNPIFSPLPSLNFAYNLSDKQLIRFAYAYTVNRPEFRELAPFRYFDFAFNSSVTGNEKLTTATIHNVDARWEYYPSPSEIVSFGVFYKRFRNPIEVFLSEASSGQLPYTFVNANDARSYGAEVEVRKSFAELSQSRLIQNLTFVVNGSYIISRVDLGGSDNAVEVSDLSDPNGIVDLTGLPDIRRPMMNQSPYLVNAGVYYNDADRGWQASILYNVFGPRLFAVGTATNPTIFEMPRNMLDISVTREFGKHWALKVGIQDLLNQRARFMQDFNLDGRISNGQDQLVRGFRPGTYVTTGLTYNF